MSSIARWVSPSLFLFCGLSASYAAGPAIGLVIADGSFQLNHSSVWGSGTLFEGSLIETGPSSSQLQLNNGVGLRLAAESRARVYTSRLVLEKGIGQLESANYRIEAASLQVTADAAGATARVQVAGPRRIVVAAHEGGARVTNSQGVLIARLNTGREMVFEPQDSGAGTTTRVSGILALKNGKFIVVDRATNVTMELQGVGLETEVGKLVEITGSVAATGPTVPGASQLLKVILIKHLVKAGSAAAGAGAAGAGTGAAVAGGGLSTGAIVAIVGGVAAAGTIGGLAAAHALPGQGDDQPPRSR